MTNNKSPPDAGTKIVAVASAKIVAVAGAKTVAVASAKTVADAGAKIFAVAGALAISTHFIRTNSGSLFVCIKCVQIASRYFHALFSHRGSERSFVRI